MGTKPPELIRVESGDRVYLRIEPFDSTVRVVVSIQHLQPGSGNSGGFVAGILVAERDGKIEMAAWESRLSAKDNVPVEFLPLQVPRALAGEMLSHMKAKPRRAIGEIDYATPQMLLH